MSSLSVEENALIDNCYRLILDLVRDAGKIVVNGFSEVSKRIDIKTASWDLVTEYDKNVEKMLINGILAQYPDHKFIAEETAADNGLTDSPTWIIDPIDGTNNYVHGIPFIGISIGFVLRKIIVIGIVYNPLLNELYRGRKGNGAFLNDKRISCSNAETLDDAVYAHEVSFARVERVRDKNLKRICKFSALAQGFRSFGCAALTLAYVAKGCVDGYQIDDLKPWDVAAGVLLIWEAGGSVYNTDGSQFDVMKPNLVCAGTEKLCQELISGIEESNSWILTIDK